MTKVNKEILIVSSEFPPQPGGIGNHAYNLALHISKSGYMVTVICDERSVSGNEEEKYDKNLPFLVMRIKRHSFRQRMYVKRLVMTYKKLKSVSCVIATGKFSLWNVALLSNFFKIKTIAVVHGTEVNFKPYLLHKSIDLALKKFDQIVAVSSYTRKFVDGLNKNISVIPNAINSVNWQLEKTNKEKLRGTPILTTVGRVSSRKGQLTVINHLPELVKTFPEIHYHCIGIPTEAKDFTEVAVKLNVENHITFHGSLSDGQLKQRLSETDIFIMLSSETETGDVEGFGIAILEANALGIPAIGSKDCGIEDAINENVSGILVEHNNTSQLIEGINTIMHDIEKYTEGSKKWAKQHDWSEIIKPYLRLIE